MSTTTETTALPTVPLQPGTPAPEFHLHSTPDQLVSLSEFHGRPVILVFYPADWSPVCGDQTALYNELLPEFHKFGAEMIGISVDGAWCHMAFAHDRKLKFPLLADYEPKGEVARAYGVYRAQDGFSERALFVIDSKGIIRWSYVSPVGINPGADGILTALEIWHRLRIRKGNKKMHASPKLTKPVSERDHVRGPAGAAVTLVEYGDFQCPHCGRAFPVVEELLRKFAGRIRFVFRNFPLTEAHEFAEIAAEAAEAAGAQGRFWEMHHALFTHQNALEPSHLVQYAGKLGIDSKKFAEDLESRAFQERVREDFLSGARSGVNGTPTFFLNGFRYDGSWDPQDFTNAMEEEIGKS